MSPEAVVKVRTVVVSATLQCSQLYLHEKTKAHKRYLKAKRERRKKRLVQRKLQAKSSKHLGDTLTGEDNIGEHDDEDAYSEDNEENTTEKLKRSENEKGKEKSQRGRESSGPGAGSVDRAAPRAYVTASRGRFRPW